MLVKLVIYTQNDDSELLFYTVQSNQCKHRPKSTNASKKTEKRLFDIGVGNEFSDITPNA